jgi:hypothetical protein
MALTPRQVYKGNPATPGYEPNKDDIIEYLNGLQTRIDAAGPVYDTPELGLAATIEGQFFNAFFGGVVNRYRHDPGPTATFIYEFPRSVAIEELYALLEDIGDYLTGELTELVSVYSGDGTSDPLQLVLSLDNPAKVELIVNGMVVRPGIDYGVSGVNLTLLPGGDLDVWPFGTDNIIVRIRRQLDLTDIDSDDVTYDGLPLTSALDTLFPGNTYHLTQYLHPDDFTAALLGNTTAQNEVRVTAAVQAFHDAALGWMMGGNGRHVRLVYPNVPLAVNDELFSEAWAQNLWANGGARSNCRVVFDFNGVRFQSKNWTARAAVRTSGLYLANGITYPVPKAMFRWERPAPSGPRIETRGRVYLFGEGSRANDPIGVKLKSINVAQLDCFFVQGFRNHGVMIENLFNSPVYGWQVSQNGYQPTEYGGEGFLPSTVRFTNVGAVVTATEAVFNSSHVGRRFMLTAAGPRNGQNWQVHSGVIASVDSPTQITLTAAPFRNVTTPRTGSFEAIKVSTTAGSNIATLSASVSDSLVGRYVTLLGAGQDDIAFNGQYYGTMTAVVTAHSGDQITLAHPARFTRSNIPISTGTNFNLFRGAENSTVVNPTAGRNDDVTFHDLRVENGSGPHDGASLSALIHHCSDISFGAGSKFHGVPAAPKNNFGSNFAQIAFDYATGISIADGLLSHSGYSASAGKIIVNGGFVDLSILAREIAFPDTTETAGILVDPTADQIAVKVQYGNTRNDGRVGNAVAARYGANGLPGMVVAYNSARRTVRGIDVIDGGDGEDAVVGTGTTPARADFPTDLDDVSITGNTFATAWGSTRANAVTRLAAGFWTPVNGVVYRIGADDYLGQTGATVLPGLPGLVPVAPYTLDQFGAVGDGVTDDTAAITAANASGLGPFDMMGRTYLTTILSSAITATVFNGTLLTINSDGNTDIYRPRPPITNAEITTTGRKSPVLDWSGRNVLWLGTSIPQEGFGTGDSYPDLVAGALDCRVVNNAWAGSRMRWDGEANIDPLGANNQIRSLSMTQADVAAGLALYGTGTVFDDAYDVVTKASEMTTDWRIVRAFQQRPFSVVVLDHNHNDRRNNVGTLTPPTTAITGATLGASTVFTVASAAGIAVGDGVTVRVTGVSALDYAFGRVTAVSGSDVTVAYDSDDLVGTVTGGTLTRLDRRTLYGAADFVISAIRNSGVRYGFGVPTIILNGAPSEYTNDARDIPIWSVNRRLEDYAAARGLAFFDIAAALDVKAEDHILYFPDAVHPTTLEARQAIARHWVEWLSGGAARFFNQAEVALLRGTPADQAGIVYSEPFGKFVPTNRLRGALTSVLSDDFGDGDYSGWTATGVTPVVIDAPWSGGGKAISFPATGANTNSYISRNVTTDIGVQCEFDLQMPVVEGLSSGTTKQVPILQLRSTGGYLSVQVVTNESGSALRLQYFNSPNTGNNNGRKAFGLLAGQKYRVKCVSFRTTTNGPGYFALFVDGALVSVLDTDDIAQTNVASVRFGIVNHNTGGDVEVILGNFALSRFAEQIPLNGSVTIGGNTVTFVNGLAVAVS